MARNWSATGLVLIASMTASAQVNLGGVSFVDLAAAGQITLGNIRGSIGVIDYDNDGWMDLFLVEVSGRPNRLFHNVASAGTPGGRTFVDVSTSSGLGTDADGTSRGFTGVVVFDYDNDGYSDIYIPVQANDRSNAGILYHNNGNGTFTNVTAGSGTRVTGIAPLCASVVDFDHDGYSDLLMASSGTPGRTLTLLRNNGNGTFTSRPDLLPTVAFSGTTYAQAFMDYDGDGWEDGLILLNNGRPLMLKNVAAAGGGRTFVDATTASGFTQVGPAPMGIAIGDVNNDGWLDVAITDAVSGTYYENRSGTLVKVTPYSTFFGWGTVYLDAENDGDLDNYQAGSAPNANIDWLIRNDGNGVFTDVRGALNTTALSSQYAARVDFDNDGREDLITVNPGTFVSVYRNQSTGMTPGLPNHWARVKLVGTGGVNADAVGAVVRLSAGGKMQVRQVAIGTSYGASEDLRAHFGLGNAASVDWIQVVWPRAGTLAERTETFAGPFGVDGQIELRPKSCAADVNGDGTLDLVDFFAFFNCFDATTPCADIDGVQGVDLNDFFVFLAAFDGGC